MADNNASSQAADGWQAVPLRAEISPRFFTQGAGAELALGIAGQGRPAADGCWQKELPAAEGARYAFTAEYLCRNTPKPLRSVLVRLIWLDAEGNKLNRGEYPQPDGVRDAAGWAKLRGVYLAPPKTARLRVDLGFRWAPEGEVLWRRIDSRPADAPASRKVRLGTVSRRPNGTTTRENLELFAADVAELAARGADIVCLPEGATLVGTGKKYADVIEPVPGPSTEFLSAAARRGKVYIVAGLYERDGEAMYNTSVLIGRDGKVVGKYRKICLPDEETVGGLCPGVDYNVFDTDFGRVGMMICWDLSYPEVARELARRGAEVIFMPIWGGNETLARARAIENQVYVVASGYDFRSAVYSPFGQLLASACRDPKQAPENVLAEVDLAQPAMWEWIGNWKSRVFREEPGR